jgi:hypothetical protein
MSESSGPEGSLAVPKPRTLKQFKRHIRKLNEKNSAGKDGFEEEFTVGANFGLIFELVTIPNRPLKSKAKTIFSPPISLVLAFLIIELKIDTSTFFLVDDFFFPSSFLSYLVLVEHTRVHLPVFSGEIGSDFINANYIDVRFALRNV